MSNLYRSRISHSSFQISEKASSTVGGGEAPVFSPALESRDCLSRRPGEARLLAHKGLSITPALNSKISSNHHHSNVRYNLCIETVCSGLRADSTHSFNPPNHEPAADQEMTRSPQDWGLDSDKQQEDEPSPSASIWESRKSSAVQTEELPTAKKGEIGIEPELKNSLSTDRIFEKFEGLLAQKNSRDKILRVLQDMDWASVSQEEFVHLCTKNMGMSYAIQHFILKRLMNDCFLHLLSCSYMQLMTHRFGCHVIRAAVQTKECSSLVANINLLYQKDFVSLCVHQFANKVLQGVCEVDPDVRVKTIEFICKHWNQVKKDIPSSYLLTVCLRHTPNDHPVFKQLIKKLMEKTQNIFHERFSKRFLINFLEFCSEKDAEVLFIGLNLKRVFLSNYRDKYVVYAIRSFLTKGHQETQDVLMECLVSDPERFLELKYFRMLLLEICTGKQFLNTKIPISSTMHSRILSILQSNPKLFLLYPDLNKLVRSIGSGKDRK